MYSLSFLIEFKNFGQTATLLENKILTVENLVSFGVGLDHMTMKLHILGNGENFLPEITLDVTPNEFNRFMISVSYVNESVLKVGQDPNCQITMTDLLKVGVFATYNFDCT
jgi:hypothetical protein